MQKKEGWETGVEKKKSQASKVLSLKMLTDEFQANFWKARRLIKQNAAEIEKMY